MSKTEYVKTEAWFKLLDKNQQKKIEIEEVVIDDYETLYVKYKENLQLSNDVLKKTNIALGASVTANARTRLHKQLSLLDDRVIYYDTDSVVYEKKHGEYNIEEGRFLGEWEDELKGGLIKKFVSTGAKSYAYECDNGKSDVKSKGITLNYGNTQENGINMNNLVKLVKGEFRDIVTKNNLRFNLNDKEGICSGNIDKKIIMTANKRIQSENFVTLPFGYVKR
jgi:hypothetical protein